MTCTNISADLNSFLKATLDSDRLKLISLISEEPLSIVDLAEKISGKPADVLRHLEILEEANLKTSADQDGKILYWFDSKSLELMARQQLSKSHNEIDLSSLDLSADQRVFINNFTRSDGSLKMIPTQSKKIIAILEYISSAFEFDAYYSEKEVNALLNPLPSGFNDPSTLHDRLWLPWTRKKWNSLLAF